MARGVLWNGKNYIIPQAASKIDSSALSQAPLGGTNRLAILGPMTGLLVPKTATKVSNAATAKQMLHPGSEEARLAVDLVFGPSKGGELAGASEVYLIPTNPATQSSLTLDGKVLLTSYLYGLTANQLQVKVETGTTGKKVSIQYPGTTEIHDNLTKSSFEITYTGAGSAAVMTITPTVAGHSLATTCTGATADNLSLDLSVYTTVQMLTDAIKATGKYTVTVTTSSPGADLTMQLDSATGVDIKTLYTAKSDLQAVVDGINKASNYVHASRVADAGSVPANSTAWTYLTGGADGSASNNDWQEAFDLLKTMSMDLIVPLSPSASIHAMADAHCVYMSGPSGKSERRAFVGGALQTWTSGTRAASITALKTAAKTLNSDRTLHAGLGSTHYDPAGVPKLYPAYITACCYAGIAAGASPELPLTRKYLNVLGLETELRISEIEDLLESGLAIPIPDTVNGAGYVVARQTTTWLQSDDLYRVEFSVGRVADYVAREVRRRLENMIGQPGTEALDVTIVNLVNGVLNQVKLAGIIRSYDPKQTQLRADGTVRYVDYSAMPVLPVNWIFSTLHLLPTTFTVQV